MNELIKKNIVKSQHENKLPNTEIAENEEVT